MKKIIVLSVGLLIASIMSYGQVEVSLGLKGGLNLAKLDISSGASNIDNRTGFHGGAFALFKLTKIGIQPEILFSKQGANFTANTTDVEANFDYINVPILLKLYLAAGLNLQLGPQFGFLTTSELVSTTSGITTTEDIKSFLDKKYETAVAVGLGWDLPFGVTLDARYNIGLSDVEVTNSTPPVSFKNQVIQISVGYKLIKLGK
ncbi:MAG: porin family protein [Bacteroidota bacterium]